MGSLIPCDCHMHTSRSFDGSNTAREMADRAAELQIPVITFTDHCEVNEFFSTGYCSSVPMAWRDANEQKQLRLGSGSTEVLVGIELGQANANYELAERILAAREYDFILASLHNILNFPDFYFLSYSEENVRLLLTRYFDELLHIVRWGRFDSLAHMTYPMRYISGRAGIHVELAEFAPAIDAVLSSLAEQGKALEINTSGVGSVTGLIPDLSIVKRFRELGGRWITVGADAHCTANVGKGIAEGVALAKEAGFSSIAVFRQHQPCEVPV